jgi:hypothetical protein
MKLFAQLETETSDRIPKGPVTDELKRGIWYGGYGFSKMDKDGDGKVSFNDMLGMLRERLRTGEDLK